MRITRSLFSEHEVSWLCIFPFLLQYLILVHPAEVSYLAVHDCNRRSQSFLCSRHRQTRIQCCPTACSEPRWRCNSCQTFGLQPCPHQVHGWHSRLAVKSDRTCLDRLDRRNCGYIPHHTCNTRLIISDCYWLFKQWLFKCCNLSNYCTFVVKKLNWISQD